MTTVLLLIHLFVTLALIGVVLIQRSEGGGLGIGTSQGMGGFMSGRGTANLLTRTTAILGTIFFLLSLALALLNRGTMGVGRSLLDTPPGATAPLQGTPIVPSAPAIVPGGPVVPGSAPAAVDPPVRAVPAPVPSGTVVAPTQTAPGGGTELAPVAPVPAAPSILPPPAPDAAIPESPPVAAAPAGSPRAEPAPAR